MGCAYKRGPWGRVKVKCKTKKPHKGSIWRGRGPSPIHRSSDDDKLWVWNFKNQKWEKVDKKDYKPGHYHWHEWDHKHTKDRWGRRFDMNYPDAADWYGLRRYGYGGGYPGERIRGPDDVDPRYRDWGIDYYKEYGQPIINDTRWRRSGWG